MDDQALRPPRIYEDLVCEHFLHPRNVGEIADADGVGAVGDPQCGDYFKVWIRVEGDLLAEVKYKVLGCPAAVATCSMMSELATGKTVGEAYELDDLDIMNALGGLPGPSNTALTMQRPLSMRPSMISSSGIPAKEWSRDRP